MHVQAATTEMHDVLIQWSDEAERPRIPYTSIAQQHFAADLMVLSWRRRQGEAWSLTGWISGRLIKHTGRLSGNHGHRIDLRTPERRAELPEPVRRLIERHTPR